MLWRQRIETAIWKSSCKYFRCILNWKRKYVELYMERNFSWAVPFIFHSYTLFSLEKNIENSKKSLARVRYWSMYLIARIYTQKNWNKKQNIRNRKKHMACDRVQLSVVQVDSQFISNDASASETLCIDKQTQLKAICRRASLILAS